MRCLLVLPLLTSVAAIAIPTVAAAATPGFVTPSKRTTCALLPAKTAGSSGTALYCASQNIRQQAYDGMGVVRLGLSGKARVISSGNDLLLAIGGRGADGSTSPRPTLRYGKTFERSGYRCLSRKTGLTCKRGNHGFSLSTSSQRYF